MTDLPKEVEYSVWGGTYSCVVVALICLAGLLWGNPGEVRRSEANCFPLPGEVEQRIVAGQSCVGLSNCSGVLRPPPLVPPSWPPLLSCRLGHHRHVWPFLAFRGHIRADVLRPVHGVAAAWLASLLDLPALCESAAPSHLSAVLRLSLLAGCFSTFAMPGQWSHVASPDAAFGPICRIGVPSYDGLVFPAGC